VLVVDAPPEVRAAFARRTAVRLACAAAAFGVPLAALLWLLPVEAVLVWMRGEPLAVVLAAASLGAARAARWWAETDRRRPLLALNLHALVQAVVLAPLLAVALDWFGAWTALPAALALAAVLAAAPRVARFHLPEQPAAAALALSAAAADPVWYVCGLVRSAATSRD
jgi:hypothetical protein